MYVCILSPFHFICPHFFFLSLLISLNFKDSTSNSNTFIRRQKSEFTFFKENLINILNCSLFLKLRIWSNILT